MKKILLGLVAAFALTTFATVARAEGDAAGGDKAPAADAKPAKKSKKSKKKADGDAAPAGDAAGGDKK